MKTLIAFLLLPLTLLATDQLILFGVETCNNKLQCKVSDGFQWIILDHLGGTTIDHWVVGDHLFYWHIPEYSPWEYRLFNMDHFSCYKVFYQGKTTEEPNRCSCKQ